MKALLLATAWFATFSVAAQDVEKEITGQEQSVAQPLPMASTAQRDAALAIVPSTGLVLIPESTNNRIMAFDPATGLMVDPNFIPSNTAQLTTPVDVVLSTDGTQVLVSDQVRDLVQAFDLATGVYSGVFAPQGGVNNAILDNIRGVELLASGNLLVTVGAGGNINTVAQFSSSGATLPLFVTAAAGGLDSPFDVYRIPASAGPLNAGEFLVSSSGTAAAPGRVFRYSATGQPLGVFATAGTFSQQVLQARNGNILVAVFSPPGGDGVFEYLPNGTLLRALDNPELAGYRGVWELANGNILTTNGNGVHEIDRTTGALIASRITGVSARYIAFVRPAAGADLAVTVNATGSSSLGESQRLIIRARNLGSNAASGASVQFSLPAFLSVGSSTCALTSNTEGLSWVIGALAGGADGECQVELRNSGIGSARIEFRIQGAGADPVPGNNVAAIVLGVNAPAVPTLSRGMLAFLLFLIAGAALWVQVPKRDG